MIITLKDRSDPTDLVYHDVERLVFEFQVPNVHLEPFHPWSRLSVFPNHLFDQGGRVLIRPHEMTRSLQSPVPPSV